MKLKIAHMYPDLLNLYGDYGNILSLKRRCEWRNIEVEVCEYSLNDTVNFDETDIFYIGGGTDKEQLAVCEKMKEYKDELKNYVEKNGVVMALCGGYQILGNYIKIKDDITQCLGILDIHTEISRACRRGSRSPGRAR